MTEWGKCQATIFRLTFNAITCSGDSVILRVLIKE
jgi:hypothetical protein